MVLQEGIRHKGIGFVCTTVINTALPAVNTVVCNRFTGTCTHTFPASVAKIAFKWLIVLKRQIRNDVHKTHKGAILRNDHLAMKTGSAQTANHRSFIKVNDDIGHRLSRLDCAGKFQLIDLLHFRIGGLIALNTETGNAAL